MDEILPGILPLAAGVIVLALGFGSIVRNPRLKVSRAFFASMFCAGMSDAAMASLLAFSGSSSADLLSRALLFTAVLAAGANIFLASSLSVWKGHSWTRDHPALVLCAVLVAATAASSSGGTVAARGPAGLAAPDDTWIIPVLLSIALVWASVGEIYSAREASTDQYFRRATTWLGLAFAMPVFSLIVVFGGGWATPAVVAAATAPLLSAVAFAFVAVHYRTFTQLPAADKAAPSSFTDSMSPGSSMLVEGKSTDAAYTLFLAELGRGGDGLVISRKHPGQVRERLGREKASVLWLCSQPGQGKVDPSSLSLLQGIITDFLRKDKRSVVLLDGLEYLVAENHPDKVLRLIYCVKDVVTVSGSKLIVPLDPDTLNEKDRAFFEREFKVLRPGPEQVRTGQLVS